jgi:hypothetical protein
MTSLSEFEKMIDKFFTENSKERISAILKKYDDMVFDGITAKDYLSSINENLEINNIMQEFSYDEFLTNYPPDDLFAASNQYSFILNESIDFSCYILNLLKVNSNMSTSFSSDMVSYKEAA